MPTTEIKEGDSLAAVDLGSNSFHLVVARYEHGQARIIDRLREPVRLAFGLDAHGNLSPERLRRALACLARFGQRLSAVPGARVRAVATQSVRKLANPRGFLMTAETALGHPIEVVSGREEARLIYLGVGRDLPNPTLRRLVVDIGGGSTEFIIGQGGQPLEMESLQVGCIASTRRFFDGDRISRKRWQRAQTEIGIELQQFAEAFRQLGWAEVIGSSGTAKSLAAVGLALGHGDELTREALEDIRERLIAGRSMEMIELPGLSDDRRPIFAGGAAVMTAVFDGLGLKSMRIAETAMREGLIYDLLGRVEHTDPRQASIDAMARRYGVDAAHSRRVESIALALFDEVATAWELSDEHRDWLAWSVRAHEIGLAIAHSQYHQHGAYLIANSDLPGFSRQEQAALSLIVRGHRRALSKADFGGLAPRIARPAFRITVLLRLAALLCRSRSAEALPPVHLDADERGLHLHLPQRWLEAQPLTRADLAQERKQLAAAGLRLLLEPV